MYNRAEIVDRNFKEFVGDGQLPSPRTQNGASPLLSSQELIDLFETQMLSRHLDLRARELKNTGHCYYTIGSSGHEGNAVFGHVFRPGDLAFLHYRSCAFFIQRSKQVPGTTPVHDVLLSLCASKEDPISGGRHKVFGSKKLNIPPQTSTIASHIPKAVGAALSISRAKDLKLQGPIEKDSVVICSFGDASTNHSSALGGFNTAAWAAHQNVPMPLVFICEDNHLGISVPTAPDWVESRFSNYPDFKYISCDGLNLLDLHDKACQAERFARVHRKPVFLHMDTVRLLGHAGSDVESVYQSLKSIEESEFNDPLLHSARTMMDLGVLSNHEILDLYEKTREQVKHVSDYVMERPRIEKCEEVMSSITASEEKRSSPPLAQKEEREKLFNKDFPKLTGPAHMAKLINWGLHDILLRYPNTLIFGEDVAQKGGVYHVTDGLYKKFGVRRVFNSPLDETNILGTAIGLAHNGFVPIPEIQFLAYIHNAEDQLRGEAATLAFFSQGQFTNPMVLRVAGLAYQKGFGGHFHNDNSLSVFRDLPGVILAVPSNGADAVKMMRTAVREAHENGRVTVFVEPIARYMTRDLIKEGDRLWSFVYPEPEEEIPLGEFGVYGSGSDLAIITYGNGYFYSRQAAYDLQEEHKVNSRVIDLRWLEPIDWQKLVHTVKDCKHILIVDECRKNGSHSEGLISGLLEHLNPLPPTQILAAENCFVPLGPAAAAGLPSRKSITQAALDLMKGPPQ